MRVWPFHRVKYTKLLYFNSHTREGVTTEQNYQQHNMTISTHTPVRVWLKLLWRTELLTISTHTPVRVWPLDLFIGFAGLDFNSHTREGVTWLRRRYRRTTKFQLTHPWGCDFDYNNRHCSPEISTHTPVRVWLRYTILHSQKIIFQLTHPWGCDLF